MDLLPASKDVTTTDKDLTEIQQRVVDALVLDSSLTALQLSIEAGCTEGYVWKILTKQHVKEYLLGQVNARLLLSSLPAMEVKHKLLTSKSDYIKDKASSDILDRNGIGNTTNINMGTQVVVNIDLS